MAGPIEANTLPLFKYNTCGLFETVLGLIFQGNGICFCIVPHHHVRLKCLVSQRTEDVSTIKIKEVI